MTEPRPTRLRDVFITACGAYLPGDPIDNEQMEDYLGLVGGKRSRMRPRILASNGITSRHYALDREGRTTHLNEQLAANAVLRALADRGLPLDELRMLALGTTLGDSLFPGFASMVHGRLGARPMEVLSAGGVCGSGMAALNAAYRALRSDTCANAVAGGSELVSRGLRASRFSEQAVDQPRAVDFGAEFLRWMLSDGAGVVLLEQGPRPDGLSLRIDFIDLVSHAGETEPCMHAGLGVDGKARAGETWLDHPTIADAERAGLLRIRQDVRMLDRMVELGLQHWLRLMREGRIVTDEIDHMVCHHSSRFFEDRFTRALVDAGALPQHGKWFTNLYTKGNTGAAAVFIALDELWRAGQLREGDRILLGVPESARFITCIAQLTCVSGRAAAQPDPAPLPDESSTPLPLRAADPQSGKGRLLIELAHVWADFERALARVPIVQRIERGTITREDYCNLLLDLRQQVVDGSRWITLAAANVSESLFWLRSMLLEHASDEHRDYELLESDFANMGGSLEVIRGAEKNVGSEALSAFIFHRAAQRDPIDLIGAMFVIEGLGARKAARWADQLAHTLQLRADQIAFLRYHGARDDDHLARLEQTIERLDLDDALIARVVKAARVVARLYALQLEHIELS